MDENRRPIKSRSNRLILMLAGTLARSAITPNQISGASVIFAAIGAVALMASDSIGAMIIAIAGIQLRLVCNVIDGLVAIEGGKRSIVGALYNEFPDRLADTLLLVAAGYAVAAPSLGWAGDLLRQSREPSRYARHPRRVAAGNPRPCPAGRRSR